MKKVIAIALMLAGVFGAYKGYQAIDGSSKGIEIGNLELKAEDKDSKATGYFYLGTGIVGIIAGAVLLARKEK